MKIKIFAAGVAVLFFSLGANAQNQGEALQKAQETLKKDLNKNVMYTKYKVDQCVVSSKTPERSFSSSSRMSPASFGARVPSDSESALSSGPGSDIYFAGSSSKGEFNLSRLDANKISIVPVPHRSGMRIQIAPLDNSEPAAVVAFGGKSFDLRFAGAVVKKKAASRIADEFREVIQLCSH